MYWHTDFESLPGRLDALGLGTAAREHGSALIKINMARAPLPSHPRTDARVLGSLLSYLSQNGVRSILCEGADGHLRRNLVASGLGEQIARGDVDVIDLDLEPAIEVEALGQAHFLPELFLRHPVRVAVPCASQREGMLFSNNVKLFVGAVPRRFYQDDQNDGWRARIHADLHRSIAAVYRAVMKHTPFTYYLNGGNAYREGMGAFELPLLVGNDAVELDIFVATELFGVELPGYLVRLHGDTPAARGGAGRLPGEGLR